MSLQPFDVAPVMGLLATTGDTGYTLVNGTGTIFSWTAPNDGQLHRVMLITDQHVTVAQTGGAILLDTTLPDGTTANPQIYAGGAGAGPVAGPATTRIVEPGSTVSLVQSTAQTVGAAVLWAELWGS